LLKNLSKKIKIILENYKFTGKSHLTKLASPLEFHETTNTITSTPFFNASLKASLYVGSNNDA
jgi:hypothetical protein